MKHEVLHVDLETRRLTSHVYLLYNMIYENSNNKKTRPNIIDTIWKELNYEIPAVFFENGAQNIVLVFNT